MAGEIKQWLEDLDLAKYANAFVENEVEVRDLTNISDEDLKELGIPMGPRKRIMRAIGQLAEIQAPVAEALNEPQAPSSQAERRQLTVMFCDLVGSTELSHRLDPEDLRDVMRDYQDAVAGCIARYDGHLANFLGDGVLAYFGWPQAYEDQTERAVRAGLDATAAVVSIKPEREPPLGAQVGIATGEVVIGDIVGETSANTEAVVGETPNLAARLQALAEPNTVVISAATLALVDGLFDFDDLGAQTVKGIEEPITPYRVTGESVVADRLEPTSVRSLTSLVGRDEEIGLLMKCWRRAMDGEGQVLLLTAEAGVGKSRVLRAFRERIEHENRNRVLFYCSPYHRNSALYPAINQLERAARFETSDTTERKLDKLEAVLGELDLPAAELAPALANVLSLPEGDRYPPLGMPPQQLRNHTLETLISLTEAMAAKHPVLMVLEDAHWIDPTTMEMINMAVDRVRSHRILLIVTARPEFIPTWGAHAHLTTLALNRLSRVECAKMVAAVADGKSLPEDIVNQILDRADGVPLFVEELTKTVVESGLLEETEDQYLLNRALPPLAIPSSLKDSLMARLDRLAEAKEVAQLAAVIGRTFGHELLAAISPADEDRLNDALARLLEAGLLYRRGLPPDAVYEFKHALVRDAAYDSLLLRTRREFHGNIANALVEKFPALAAPKIVAHHFTEAGNAEKAVDYWQIAGQQASRRSASLEAISQLTAGLAMLESLPESQDRDRRELGLRIDMTAPIMASQGFSSPEMERNVERSLELSRRIGATPEMFPVLYGRWVYFYTAGQTAIALETADEVSRLAARQNSDAPRMVGHRTKGISLISLGRFDEALAELEAGDRLYDPQKHRPLANLYGMDFRSTYLSYLCLADWFMGYPDRAVARSQAAIQHAESLDHPNSLGHALNFAGAFLASFGRRFDDAVRTAQRMIALAEEHHMPQWGLIAQIFIGWAMIANGRYEEGAAAMQACIDKMLAMSIRAYVTLSYAGLADGQLRSGDSAAAMASISAAEEVILGGERMFEAEVKRVKAQIQVLQSDVNGAEESLKSAIAVATRRKGPYRGNYVQRRIWRSFTVIEIGSPKHTACFPPSTTNSPKGLIRRTSWLRRHFWKR